MHHDEVVSLVALVLPGGADARYFTFAGDIYEVQRSGDGWTITRRGTHSTEPVEPAVTVEESTTGWRAYTRQRDFCIEDDILFLAIAAVLDEVCDDAPDTTVQ
ncbi:MAG: hypothetical protein IJO71_01460 [Microbacterium sp.]|uniref:hypothetical protein n=1 Tax=Microbacterium sp. TaxID=51671 RepID=UPI0025EF9681|nr:hypothetical protein [Microbacterium sp.]MBQ9915853.1 hypothetical protein [Microbacterium sp.]